MNNSNTQTTTSALLSPVTLEQELDLFFVILLDSYYHSLKGLIEFVEKNQCYSFTTNEGRERFLRLMFSLRNAVTQFPSGFEYNLRSIDRMVKHSLHVTLLFPWKVDDLTKPHYINASFFAAPFERTPNPMFEKLVKSDQELKNTEQTLKQVKFVGHELQLKKIALQAKLQQAQVPAIDTDKVVPTILLGSRGRSMSTSGTNLPNIRRSRSMGRPPSSTTTSSSINKK